MRASLKLAGTAAFLSMVAVMILKSFTDTLFLSTYGIVYVPHFFVAQAVVTVAAASGYSALIKRGAGLRLEVTLLLAIAAVAGASPWIVGKWTGAVFAVCLALVAGTTLAAIAVWNAAIAIVTGRRARAHVPRVGAAATVGGAAGGFLATGLVSFAGLYSLALTASLLCAGLAYLQLVLRRMGHSANAASSSRVPRVRWAGNHLIQYLIAATIVESLISAFIDYGFKSHVSSQFTRDEMGRFFALFYGTSSLVLLGVQVWLTRRLLVTRPLRLTLSLPPAAIIVLGIFWTLFPVLALATLGRVVESVGKFAVSRPGQEVALAPLSERARQRWKVLLRGVFAQGAAAGGGLIVLAAAPLLSANAAIAPAVAAALGVLWLMLQRNVAKHYLDALGSQLGVFGLSVRDAPDRIGFDRDGLAKIVELAGSTDTHMARFGRSLLYMAAEQPNVVLPHVAHIDDNVRRVVYEFLAAHPSQLAVNHLLSQISRETNPAAQEALLRALAAHGDGTIVDYARAITSNVELPQTTALEQSAWAYLALAGALDREPDTYRLVVTTIVKSRGPDAATILRRGVERGVVSETDADNILTGALDELQGAERTQALAAAAASGRSKPLVRILKELESNPTALQHFRHFDELGLPRLIMLAGARNPNSKLRARLVRATAICDLIASHEYLLRCLTDNDSHVRSLAATSLHKRARDLDYDIDSERVEAGLAFELDVLERYVRARPRYGDARESRIAFRHNSASDIDDDTFFRDELERRCEQSISRVCSMLALLGNASKVSAAERSLLSLHYGRRQRGVDILQEVIRGPYRRRLFALLDRFLTPRNAPTDIDRRAVCEIDPWLAHCLSDEIHDLRAKLWGLRLTKLFDAVSGEALTRLADNVDERTAAKGEVIVKHDTPAIALYIVIRGRLVATHAGIDTPIYRGQSFGELSLIDGEPYNATLTAVTKARYLRLPRDAFQAALSKYPAIGLGLVRVLAKWLRQQDTNASPITSAE